MKPGAIFTKLFCLALALTAPAYAANRDVPGSYASVQAAVDAASVTGDEVHITVAGSYAGAVTITDKNLGIIADVSGVTITGTITCAGTSVVALDNVTVDTAGDGIYQYSSGALTITNSSISGNGTRGIVHSAPGDVNLVSTWLTSNAFDGYDRVDAGGALNISGNCLIASNSRSGLIFEGGTNATVTITGSTIRDNPNGIYVAGGSGLTININAGTELRTNNVGVFVPGGSGTTINVNGATLRNNPQDQILLHQPVNLTMNGATIESTTSPSFKAGVRFDASAGASAVSTANFTNCTFNCGFNSDCLYVAHKTNLTLTQCTFTGYANALAVTDTAAPASIVMSRTTFAGSFAVPVNLSNSDANAPHVLTADRCRLTGVTARNLMVAVGTQATLRNTVFEGGDVQVWSQGTQATIKAHHCTLVGAATRGLYFANSSATGNEAINCIMDEAGTGMDYAGGITVVNHHNLVRATGGFGNIPVGSATLQNVDPQFVTASSGPGTGDFHLLTTSPAIITADAALGIVVDYDGNTRPMPVATAPDMGAYEEQSQVPVELSGFNVE